MGDKIHKKRYDELTDEEKQQLQQELDALAEEDAKTDGGVGQ